MAIPKPPLPDAPPLPHISPHAPPLPDLPTTAPLPVVTAGRSGLPPFMSRLKAKRGRTPRAPLAPIASRAAEKGERQREAVETAKAVKQATGTPANVTPIRPNVTPEPAPKPPSKAQEMRDKMRDVFGDRVANSLQGTPKGKQSAEEIVRQYGALHGRHMMREYHAAGLDRAKDLLAMARAQHEPQTTPANAGVKRAMAGATSARDELHEPIPEEAQAEYRKNEQLRAMKEAQLGDLGRFATEAQEVHEGKRRTFENKRLGSTDKPQ